MADEIQYSITLTYKNAAFNIAALTVSSGNDLASIANQPGPWERNVLTTTTSKAGIPTSLVSVLGLAVLHNCDAVNSISVYATASDANPCLTLLPGEWQLVRFAQTAVPNVAASAGTALLEYIVFGN